MRKGFRPALEPPSHRRAVVEARRPVLCAVLTICVVLLVFAIFGVSSWNVYKHRFSVNTYFYHTQDEVSLSQVADDLSATFCDAYSITTTGSARVFLLPSSASVNTTSPEEIPVEFRQQPNRVFNVKDVYLLQESSVNVTVCREKDSPPSYANVVFIQGDSNFQSWRQNNFCDKCVVQRVHIPDNAYCDNVHERHRTRLYYKVQSNDRYYLVIFYGRPQINHRVEDPGIMLTGVFTRTHFETVNPEKICNIIYDASCNFNLPWMSNKDVVVKFGGVHWNTAPVILTTQCKTRVVFWVCLFGVLPVLCVIPVSFLFGCFFCRRTQRNAKAKRENQQRRVARQNMSMSRSGQPIGNVVPQNEDYGSMAIQFG